VLQQITRNANFTRTKDPKAPSRMLSNRAVLTTAKPHVSRGFKSGELVDELLASDNAIYQSLDKEVTIESEYDTPSLSVFEDVKDPARLREFFVIKEILDKPVSRRRTRNFV